MVRNQTSASIGEMFQKDSMETNCLPVKRFLSLDEWDNLEKALGMGEVIAKVA